MMMMINEACSTINDENVEDKMMVKKKK
jgi:hypothetical protein